MFDQQTSENDKCDFVKETVQEPKTQETDFNDYEKELYLGLTRLRRSRSRLDFENFHYTPKSPLAATRTTLVSPRMSMCDKEK